MSNLFQYINNRAGNWFDEEIKPKTEGCAEIDVEILSELFEILKSMKVYKLHESGIGKEMEAEFGVTKVLLESKTGVPMDDWEKIEDVKEMARITKIVIPCIWGVRMRYYYLYKVARMFLWIIVYKSIFNIINPKWWWNTIKDYRGQR